MSAGRAVAALIVAAVLVGCRKPPPEDRAEAAYRHAVELFAKASAETHDLSYRDRRFDEVLAALDQVPAGDELRPKAEALERQILVARSEAEALDREGDEKVANDLAQPAFVPLPKDAPLPSAARSGAGAAPSPAATPSSSWAAPAGPSTQSIGNKALPAYYRRRFDNTPPGLARPVVAAQPAAPPLSPETPAPPAQPAGPQVRPSASSTTEESQGPPPVYGLPGPAARALLGH